MAAGSVTTTVFQDRSPRFYRRVDETSLYDAVYPSMLYYQDKLEGAALKGITVCGYDVDPAPAMEELKARLGVAVKGAEPYKVEDIYKPALGAVELIYEQA
jgi:hypothetical protein